MGNLNNDGKLEVVALCKDSLKVWNNQGQIILAKKVLGIGQFADNQAPILADVDGDPEIEIIFGSGIDNKVYAYNLDGTMAQGFPLNTEGNSNFFYNSVCVADIDNNGKNEVIASIVNKVYVWETDGLSSRIEWGSQRHDPQNTGEYFKICDPKIITANTTWTSNQTFCGDLIIHTGTLTINATSTVTMDPGSMIIIKKGAKLIINGGKIMNANLKAISGSTVILQNDAYVKLSRKGEFNIMGGASFEYIKGNIDVTP